jgi:hypothetical protein
MIGSAARTSAIVATRIDESEVDTIDVRWMFAGRRSSWLV